VTANLRSKSWDEFSVEGSVLLDVVITLCDSAAAEECPLWAGDPRTMHWGLADPAAIEDPDMCRQAFESTLATIERGIADILGDSG
jgi:arsenate reductase